MKDFLPIILRFLPPYKKWLLLNFTFNLLSGLFAVFSVAMMIPMLEIILQQGKEVFEFTPWRLEFAVFKNNLYYYITLLKDEYGLSMRENDFTAGTLLRSCT
jgi:subfamily B ATP-binding cassette protein MsbA